MPRLNSCLEGLGAPLANTLAGPPDKTKLVLCPSLVSVDVLDTPNAVGMGTPPERYMVLVKWCPSWEEWEIGVNICPFFGLDANSCSLPVQPQPEQHTDHRVVI